MKSTIQFLVSILVLFSFSLLCELAIAQNKIINSTFDVGVVLDLETWVGKMSESCISMALSDFYATHNYSTKLTLHWRDSKEDNVAAAFMVMDLLKTVEVQAIIGPMKSAQAEFVVELGDKAHVPIISFSATSPSLSSIPTPYFIRAAQNDSSQAKAIAAIIQTFNWREVIPIYEDTDFGNGIIPYLSDAFQEIEARIPYRSVIPRSATDDRILSELYKLMTMQTRVFVVHMSSSSGVRIFSKAKEVGMMSEGYVWIITDGLTTLLDSMDSSVIDSMQGVLGVKPYVPKSKELDNYTARWKRKFRRENPDIERTELSVFGLWAYDTTWALAMAAEKIRVSNSSLQKPQTKDNLTNITVSEMGQKLRDEILKTKFKGLSGNFVLLDGQLQSSAFQIVNVIGKGEREIGFWSPGNGITRGLEGGNEKILKSIIWPGESTALPKGWVIPTSGKGMRIGVPVKDGFSEFLNVERDSVTNRTDVTGFSKEVFDAVLKELPYGLPHYFVPFNGSYDNLIFQIYLQKFDAVMGDTTIRANRSFYADFTLPYSESGVTMIVPIKDDRKNKNAWVFLKPLTKDLWLSSGAAAIFTGFVVWVLEHRINEEFRGPPDHQIGVMLWFSFSTLVFAHKEKLVSNLSRFVVIIWVFVELILMSSYTASLTSMLTVLQLQPTITDVKELIKNGHYVGYQRDSFVHGLLKKMNFEESKLRGYNTAEEYAEALSKGSWNGGVSAIFDEIPYIKLFLNKYCGEYTMVGPTYKTDGWGFVFPRGSPLVLDISRAILNVTEGDQMKAIERKWFGNQTTCREQDTTITSNSLTLDSFWGLFLITGIASASALFLFLVLFLYKHRHISTMDDSKKSIRCKLIALAKHFDQKDLSSYPFKPNQPSRGLTIGTSTSTEASLNFNNSQSALSISNHLSESFVPEEDHGVSSSELGSPSIDTQPSREIN
ncbi:glutamate receptor 2.7-like [Tasmannia lanceolata]|uniref:glutamate receptor 2.7-like n=1 Tax=Tasmannia lanceolata TaxID=3420 RepID=UPI0040630B16